MIDCYVIPVYFSGHFRCYYLSFISYVLLPYTSIIQAQPWGSATFVQHLKLIATVISYYPDFYLFMNKLHFQLAYSCKGRKVQNHTLIHSYRNIQKRQNILLLYIENSCTSMQAPNRTRNAMNATNSSYLQLPMKHALHPFPNIKTLSLLYKIEETAMIAYFLSQQ